jgi:hypothetical protein
MELDSYYVQWHQKTSEIPDTEKKTQRQLADPARGDSKGWDFT